MDDDLWRQDGSFRGIDERGTQGRTKGTARSSKSGPQFTRVIPKFLQKYQQPAAILAKFPAVDKVDSEEEELDEVQEAAIKAYLDNEDGKSDVFETIASRKKTSKTETIRKGPQKRAINKINGTREIRKEKKLRSNVGRPRVNDKRLLSFAIDDEQGEI